MKLIIFILIFSLTGCSTTPGDAALRGGHHYEAANLYSNGAKQGDSTAALKLGLLIAEGFDGSAKYGSAMVWFQKSCELGNVTGCHNSGYGYETGSHENKENFENAYKYYVLAAEKGYMQSQYNLGSMYSNQYLNNDIEGLKWILISQKTAKECVAEEQCKWVLEDPPKHKNRLIERMTVEQIMEAEKLFKNWSKS